MQRFFAGSISQKSPLSFDDSASFCAFIQNTSILAEIFHFDGYKWMTKRTSFSRCPIPGWRQVERFPTTTSKKPGPEQQTVVPAPAFTNSLLISRLVLPKGMATIGMPLTSCQLSEWNADRIYFPIFCCFGLLPL